MAASVYPLFPKRQTALDVLGIPLHDVTVKEVHSLIGEVIKQNAKALVLNLNVHCVNLALKNPWLRDFLNEAQLVFCDGDGVRWGLRWLGHKPPPKITYAYWIWQLAGFCDKKRYRLFFLGGKPGVAQAAGNNLKARFPGLQISGVQDGYFEKEGEENEKVIQEINRAKPDILVVGFGMPLQEKWLKENWRRLDAHIFLTAGAVFDYVSGRLARAPEWMIDHELEWLFRLFQEPGRLAARYVLGIPYFFFQILLEKARMKKEKGVLNP